MPFSWKKTRRNRFSQLVADHLQSPKRGGSLVVETGFPTSLIDLYVRNRGRFRKSCAKKSIDSPPPSGFPVDSNNMSSSLSYSLVDSIKCSSGGSDHTGIDEIIEEDVTVGVPRASSDGNIINFTEIEVELTQLSVEMVKLNPALVVVLKVMFMVVLVLITKRFTVGITILAFLLLFLESVGKQLFARLSFNEINNIRSSEKDTNHGVCNEVVEIEEEGELKREVGLDKELDEVRSKVKHKSSRRAIMKSRMKKLVPKKLLKSSMGSKEGISYKFIEEEEETVRSSEYSDSKGESLRILKQNQDKIVEIEVKSSEIGCNDNQNSGCLVMCLIVLVGLIGGRVLALVLALSWCWMMKKLQWRNVKFPIS